MNLQRLWMFAAALAAGTLGIGLYAGAQEGHPRTTAPARPCLDPGAWSTLDGDRPRAASGSAVLNGMAQRDVVLLGEQHDEDDDHRWQLQVLAALHSRRPDMVIGFEMFPRRTQPVLDRWVAGELTAKQLLEQAEWDTVWKLPAELYLP